MDEEPVNCGRCAHLWNRESNHPGFGRCACNARYRQTGELRPMVQLDSSCDHAQLSAKFDPEFIPRLRAQRFREDQEDWGMLPETAAAASPIDSQETTQLDLI